MSPIRGQIYKSPEFSIVMSTEETENRVFVVAKGLPRKTSLNPPRFKNVQVRNGMVYGGHTYTTRYGWQLGKYITYIEYKHTFIGKWSYKFLESLNLPSCNRKWGKITIKTESKDENKDWMNMFKEEMGKALVKMKQEKDKIIRVSASELVHLYAGSLYDLFDVEFDYDDDYESSESELIVEP